MTTTGPDRGGDGGRDAPSESPSGRGGDGSGRGDVGDGGVPRGPSEGRVGSAAPRLFPSRLTRRQRRVYGAVLVFYLALTAAVVWPVYAEFGAIRPLVLGMPFSLFYVVLWVVASFLVLLGVYVWEGRRGDGAARPTSRRPEPGSTGSGPRPAGRETGHGEHGPRAGRGSGGSGGAPGDREGVGPHRTG